MAALMQGSQDDLVEMLVEESPHVMISVETRRPRAQAASDVFDVASYSGLRPPDDRRGILNPAAIRASLRNWVPGNVAALMTLQAVVRYGGNDVGVSVVGIDPVEFARVSTLPTNMRSGRLADLAATSAGAIIGSGVASDLGVNVGDSITVTSALEVTRRFNVVGIFHTGLAAEDNNVAYVLLRQAQTLAQQTGAVNGIRLKLADPYDADRIARQIEALHGLHAQSWQETNSSLMEALVVRNAIMYTVVGAILLVAGFGIYNIVSTITHEKARDIAILKSLGFRAATCAACSSSRACRWGRGLAHRLGARLWADRAPGRDLRSRSRARSRSRNLPVVVDPLHYAHRRRFRAGIRRCRGLPAGAQGRRGSIRSTSSGARRDGAGRGARRHAQCCRAWCR
jgi:lipoprotein-releasing system permease protein